MEPNGILIYAQLSENNTIEPVVLELLTKARELKEKLWNQRIMTCIIGPRINYDEIIKTLGEYGSDEAVVVCDDRLKRYDKEYYSYIFTEVAKKNPPRVILIGATAQGKEIAPYTAAELETGLTADCINLNISDNNLLLSTRPTFGGQLTADILCSTFPQMATVRANVFKAEKHEVNPNVTFDWFDIDKIEKKIEIIEINKKSKSSNDIENAGILVSGGVGACKDNGFALIHELAYKLKAKVSGSRGAYEKAYIAKSQQVGQTGKTVAPKLYLAFGISGANQHLAGINNNSKIIAVNKDKNAPIFNHADIGMTGDLFEIIPKLIEEIDKEEADEQ